MKDINTIAQCELFTSKKKIIKALKLYMKTTEKGYLFDSFNMKIVSDNVRSYIPLNFLRLKVSEW